MTDCRSHLLAKQGKAERIGDLVGQLDFTGQRNRMDQGKSLKLELDEQLARTQKGLQGVSMPNFGDVRKTLAKEASWIEPEEPEETADESTFPTSPLVPSPDIAFQEGIASSWTANQLS